VRSAACRNRNHVASGIDCRAPRGIAQVEHNGREASGLKQKIRSAKPDPVSSMVSFSDRGVREARGWICGRSRIAPRAVGGGLRRSPRPIPDRKHHSYPPRRRRGPRPFAGKKGEGGLVRPKMGPVISPMAPTGRPPPAAGLPPQCPSAQPSRIVQGPASARGKAAGEGVLIWRRRAAAAGMARRPIFAFYSLRFAPRPIGCQRVYPWIWL
jgi:hypothetical protein